MIRDKVAPIQQEIAAGWEARALREEIRPEFSRDSGGHNDSEGTLIIATDDRPGLHGFWSKSFPVIGGHHYQFRARKKTDNIVCSRRAAHVTISWSDGDGGPVFRDRQPRFALETFTDPLGLSPRVVRPEYPRDEATDNADWIQVVGSFVAPVGAVEAVVDLHLRWTQNSTVRWSDISLREVRPRTRQARLASVNLWPRDDVTFDATQAARELFAGPIQEAADGGADLVCLPECLTRKFSTLSTADAAEPVPGPSTEYFGQLAKAHDLYIVAGIYERDEHLVYNSAIMVGPDGQLIGTYRKACLTPWEGCSGEVTPGSEFPVFDTRLGKIGMMICWDMQFPEVARALSNNGAEIIAVPVAGMNPILASARAIENQVYIITSAYSSATRKDWLRSGIIDYDGQMMAATEEWGTVAMADVSLGDEPRYWAHLGDLKGQIPRMRPVVDV